MTQTKKFFCTDLAWQYGIPLVGTATRGAVWLLLEYVGRWGAKAVAESELPEAVKSALDESQYPKGQMRSLLIRQEGSRNRAGYRFFIAQADPVEPRLYEYHLDAYEDLLKLDLAGLIAGEPGDPDRLRSEALYLVCTNGKRDQCCSIYGPENYAALQGAGGAAVWQSSHIGGHNQAPIALFFPHGVNYGHMTPSESRRLVEAYQQGEVILHHYRGRVGLAPHIQAAEHFYRVQFGEFGLPGIRVGEVSQTHDDAWQITIEAVGGEHRVRIGVRREQSDYEIPITCSRQKSAPIVTWHSMEAGEQDG